MIVNFLSKSKILVLCIVFFCVGMIEIVRDAVTIAAIQRIQGGTTGAFKNNALYDWLKGICPLQEKVQY